MRYPKVSHSWLDVPNFLDKGLLDDLSESMQEVTVATETTDDIFTGEISLINPVQSANPALDIRPLNEKPAAAKPMFEAADDLDADNSDSSEPDLELNEINRDWAKLMLELDTLMGVTHLGKKKRKGAKAEVVLDTPESHRLRQRIARLEKEYMFSRKDAGELII